LSGFLAKLGARAIGAVDVVRPRTPTRFEPAAGPVPMQTREPVAAEMGQDWPIGDWNQRGDFVAESTPARAIASPEDSLGGYATVPPESRHARVGGGDGGARERRAPRERQQRLPSRRSEGGGARVAGRRPAAPEPAALSTPTPSGASAFDMALHGPSQTVISPVHGDWVDTAAGRTLMAAGASFDGLPAQETDRPAPPSPPGLASFPGVLLDRADPDPSPAESQEPLEPHQLAPGMRPHVSPPGLTLETRWMEDRRGAQVDGERRASSAPTSRPEATSTPPAIDIRIGRIEVHAEHAGNGPDRRHTKGPDRIPSLAEYLGRRRDR
jgi:hypothetical protein